MNAHMNPVPVRRRMAAERRTAGAPAAEWAHIAPATAGAAAMGAAADEPLVAASSPRVSLEGGAALLGVTIVELSGWRE
jgi:hypothetical protein